jgi:hypothetical protein
VPSLTFVLISIAVNGLRFCLCFAMSLASRVP